MPTLSFSPFARATQYIGCRTASGTGDGVTVRGGDGSRAVRRLMILTLCLTMGVFGGIVGLPGWGPKVAAANPNYAAVVVDANSGRVIFSRHADAQRYPASLTKMMTLYLLFEAMDQGKYTTASRLKVSARAAQQPPSKLGVSAGSTITVETAIRALVARSANDVAVVVAENLAGSEAAFASRMTQKARSLGMKNTVFRNASGLPDTGQVTSAKDMIVLGMALQRHFPRYYSYFSTESFRWGGKTYTSHNHVVRQYRGADGLKTGYIRASGFNVVSSAKRGQNRVIAVVMGGKTAQSRDAHMMDLLDQGFARLDEQRRTGRVASTGSPITVASLGTGRGFGRTEMGSAIDPPRPAPLKPGTQSQGYQLAMAGTTPGPANLLPSSPASAQVAPVVGGTATAPTLGVPYPPAALPAARGGLQAAATTATDRRSLEVESAAYPTFNAGGGSWGVQVGAFAQSDRAETFAANARSVLDGQLQTNTMAAVVVPVSVATGTVYRARLLGLPSMEDAKRACVILNKANWSCLLVNPNGENVLSR